jgi:hypothetical protein
VTGQGFLFDTVSSLHHDAARMRRTKSQLLNNRESPISNPRCALTSFPYKRVLRKPECETLISLRVL